MDKYYTPELNEFYVGFEYEIFEDFDVPGKEKEWHKQVYGKNGADPENIDYVFPLMGKMDKFRVKYPTKEDIEACGWVHDPSWKNYTTYLIANQFKLCHKGGNRYGIYENVGQWNKVCFEGEIKNKSELSRVMKMVGI